jgi:hypothetical protein
MKKNALIVAVLLLSTQLFIACRSSKPSSVEIVTTQQKEQSLSICEQKVKYQFSRIKKSNTLEETDEPTEMIINPVKKLITISGVSVNKETRFKNITIESIECSLNNALTEGSAGYKFLEEGPNGNTQEIVIKFEAKEDGLTITFINNGKEKAITKVDKWELLK